MAKNGSTTVLVQEQAFNAKTYLKFEWTVDSQNIENNSTIVDWTMTFYGENGGGNAFSDDYHTYNIVVNGVSYTGTVNLELLANESKVLASGSTTIKHNLNGSKTFSYTFEQNFNHGLIKGSGTGTLDTILQKATVNSVPTSFTDEDNPTITYFNPNGGSVTSLQACIANSTGGYVWVAYRDIPKTGTTYTFNLTDNERSILRGQASGNTLAVRFYIKTVINNQIILHSLPSTMTIVDNKPVLNPEVSNVNSASLALTGDPYTLIPGYNTMSYHINAEAVKDATIVYQSASCGSETKTTSDGAFVNVEDNVFKFYVEDSRGNVTTKNLTLNYVPYFKITCNQLIVLNLDGTISITINGRYFSGSFGAVNNTLTIQTRFSRNGVWEDWHDLSPLGANLSNGYYTLNTILSGFDPSGTYEFQSRAIDKLNTAYSGYDSIVLKPIFDWGRYDFNFNVPVSIEGQPIEDFVIETGVETMGSNGTWYWRKWRSGRAECYGRRNYGNMAVTTAWGGLFCSGTFTQSFPSGLFTATPEVMDITLSGGSYGGFIAMHQDSAPSSSTTGSFIVVRPASATISQAYISFNIIGRWY